MSRGTAYRLVTERLVVRALDPRDAEELAGVIAANEHHLRPWIEWAREGPRTLEAAVDVTRRMRGRFDLGESFAFAVLLADRIVGGAALTPNSSDASASIGYWLAKDVTGKGFASETVSALVRAAFEIENLELVEIHCAPENEKSAAVARRVGFRHDATLRLRLRAEDGSRSDRATYSITKADYPSTPAARAVVTAYDVIDRVVLEPRSTSSRSPFR
ncbi:MAG: GNAT family protein [Planctomycetota bacterium]|nr:GNAT family protein [Planctomycetota bacterium]